MSAIEGAAAAAAEAEEAEEAEEVEEEELEEEVAVAAEGAAPAPSEEECLRFMVDEKGICGLCRGGERRLRSRARREGARRK